MLLVELGKRKRKLELIISVCRKTISEAPEGNLRIYTCNGVARYFQHIQNNRGNGRYLSMRTQSDKIGELVQKEYCQKALEDAEAELTLINELIEIEKQQPVARVLDMIDDRKRYFVKPLEKTLEQRHKDWKQLKYTRQEERAGSFLWKTKRGEIVKSRAEMDIADCLFDAGIDYKYEFPVETDDKMLTAPDFMIFHPVTGETVYWEHFGMMDKPSYSKKTISKISSYYLSEMFPGNGMIMTFDDGDNPLDKFTINRIIKKLLK